MDCDPLRRADHRYLAEVVGRLQSRLGPALRGVSLTGSGALGDWDPARSDLDVLVVADGPVARGVAAQIAGDLRHAVLPCPARQLELVLYETAAIAGPGARVDFALNLNTGAGRDDHVAYEAAGEPAHWFLLDLALARRHARPLLGPPPATLIGPVPEEHVVAAQRASIAWYRANVGPTPDTVLNACRVWHHHATATFASKPAAGRWVLAQAPELHVVADALARFTDRAAPLDPAATEALLNRVDALLVAGSPRCGAQSARI